MNWEKLNINEVVYYCTSWDIDFDCLPFSCQIENIIQLFYYYGIVEFETGDIKEFYKRFQITSPRSGKIRNPRLKTIQNSLEHTKDICRVSENVYRISNINTDNYELCIKQGYSKNAIRK